MPLFGKKEKSNSEKAPGQAAYPTQASYPTQAAYPVQNYGAGAAAYPGHQGIVGAPPPYTAVAPSYPAPSQPMPPPANQTPCPPSYSYPQQHTVVVQGGFDAGARFNGNSRPTIPPPPPGCMLHPAQMAAMQGSNVVVTQRPGDFWSGGSDGGYTLF